MKENSKLGVNSSKNSSVNSNTNSNFKARLKAIFALPKWAKVFLAVLSVVAVAGLITAFSLKAWAADKVESGELVLNGIDKGMQKRLDSGFAFDGRLYFARLDFLLRSKVIAYIDIVGISWGENIDKNAISDISSHNRHIKFITSQDLQGLNAQNIGKVEYKMDFSPLIYTILKYYLIISLVFYGFVVLYKILCNETHTKKIISSLTQNSLPSVLWQGYKSINPLYRHTFWIVFIALNFMFGFHTIHFLLGNHDWHTTIGENPMLLTFSQGRYTQNIISMFLQGEKLLPILNNALAFIGLALASVWLCMYLNIQRKLWIWVAIGFVLTLSPFTLTRLYFTFQVAGLFIAVAIGILGFVLAKKAGEYNANALVANGGGGG